MEVQKGKKLSAGETWADMWESDHARFKEEMDVEIAKDRITKAQITHRGKIYAAQVGRSHPFYKLPIRAIYLETRCNCYIVCCYAAIFIYAVPESLREPNR